MPKKQVILLALSLAAAVFGLFQPSIASAVTLVPVSAASFAATSDQAGGFNSVHSHDSFGTSGVYATPALEVGGGFVETTSGNHTFLDGEEARGMVEYDLGNLTNMNLGGAVLSFRLGGEGLAEERNDASSQQTQYDNLIDVQGYVGEGIVETSDFDSGFIASAGQVQIPVGATTAGGYSNPPYVAPGFLPFTDGDLFQIDITTMVNQLLLDGHQFLGIRLDSLSDYAPACGGSICVRTRGHVLYDVRMQISVPEPGALTIFGLGLAGIGFTRGRKQAA